MPSSWWRHWRPCMSAAQRRFQAPSPEPVWKSPAAPTDLRPAARGWRSGPLCIGSGEAVRGWVRVSGHLDAPAAAGLSPLPEQAACELARALGSSRRPEGAECSGNVAGSSGAGLARWAEQNMASAPRRGGGAGMADTRPHEVGSAGPWGLGLEACRAVVPRLLLPCGSVPPAAAPCALWVGRSCERPHLRQEAPRRLLEGSVLALGHPIG